MFKVIVTEGFTDYRGKSLDSGSIASRFQRSKDANSYMQLLYFIEVLILL